MTLNFCKTFVLFSSLATAFVSSQTLAMEKDFKEPAAPTQKYSQVNMKRNVGESSINPLIKNPQDIFNKLNTSLSFLLTTQEVMATTLKESIVCDGTFIIQASVDKAIPFWKELTSSDPTMFSLNALEVACHFINKYNLLHELAGIDKGLLQLIQETPGNLLPCFFPSLSPDLIKFIQENPNILKRFIDIMMNAYEDEEIAHIIKNNDLFFTIAQSPILLKIVGGKDLFPLQMANNQSARRAQILFIQAEIQELIDTILIFKNLIFPGGLVSSYHHNQAVHAYSHFGVVLKSFQKNTDKVKEFVSWIDEGNETDPRLDFVKFWENYRSVLMENYQILLKVSPQTFVKPKGITKGKFYQVYNDKTTKINEYKDKLFSLKEIAHKISMQLMLNALKPKEAHLQSQKISTQISCNFLLKELRGKEYPIEELFNNLEHVLADVLKARKEMGLTPQSFFLEHFFQDLQKAMYPLSLKVDNGATPLNVSLSEEKASKKSKNKAKKRKSQIQCQQPAKGQKKGLQEPVQVVASLNAQLPQGEASQGGEGTSTMTVSPPEEDAEQASSMAISPMKIEEEIKFGADYFKQIHAYYQNLKKNQKGQPSTQETSSSLTPYEYELYTYLKDNVFNNSNRPSWSTLVQDLSGLGFKGKPNDVGNGSTWVFSVTDKNGLFYADENYRDVTFNVHYVHGKKGNEPIPIPYLKFFQSGFGHMFGLTKEVVEARLQQHKAKNR